MKQLYFIRHALSEDNLKGVFSSKNDCELASDGILQAQKAGQKLKSAKIDVIVSSPLKRSVQTAEIIADQIGHDKENIQTHELLIERDLGELEGTPYPAERPTHTYQGVESFDELTGRAQQAFDWIKSLGHENVLIVSHGSTGRALRKVVLPASNQDAKIENAVIERWI